eukprot:scaffold1803_cov92-Amphora_coffeaeformis.AAC.42
MSHRTHLLHSVNPKWMNTSAIHYNAFVFVHIPSVHLPEMGFSPLHYDPMGCTRNVPELEHLA